MIVGSAPLRVSLLGGGTDIPSFFMKTTGAVLGGSIDKRVFVCVLDMVSSAEFPFRFTYRRVDNALKKSDIQHPAWRALLIENTGVSRLNAATFSDVPGLSGLGSSSAFTVAGLAALKSFQKINIVPHEISAEAIRIEREILKEPGGWQDQMHSSYGGFRLYRFEKDKVVVGDNLLTEAEMNQLNQSSILVKVGGERDSKLFHSAVENRISDRDFNNLQDQAKLAIQGADVLSSPRSWDTKFKALLELVSENWELKKSVKDRSSSIIDELIDFGLRNGASASKLCGAGGSGYVLFLGLPDGVRNLAKILQNRDILDFEFKTKGVEAIEI